MSTQDEAARVLAALERLALVLLRRDTADLEEALRAEQKEAPEGVPARASLTPASVVSMRCLDDLALWRKAHDARVRIAAEEAAHDTIRDPKVLDRGEQ